MNDRRINYGTDGNPKAALMVLCVWIAVDAFLFVLSSSLLFRIAAYVLLAVGMLYNLVLFGWWLPYVWVGKLKHRDALLSLLDWNGNETVLDIGTGRGLLLVGAAKRVPHGKAVGIDIWRAGDMADNGPHGAQENATLEGVVERVELKTEDIRATSFPPATFDVVLSNLCLHNIADKGERARACEEIVRILKPGGVAVISDGFHIKEYRKIFDAAGLATGVVRPTFPPSFVRIPTVIATKKGGGIRPRRQRWSLASRKSMRFSKSHIGSRFSTALPKPPSKDNGTQVDCSVRFKVQGKQ